jgi:predicted Ser/Thr protein kinase
VEDVNAIVEEFNSILEAAEKKGVKFKKIKFEELTSYPFIGRGAQGAVFKISVDRCIKIYKLQEDVLTEREVLEAAQDSSIVPRLYEAGPNYLIMEYIEGPSLGEYLKSNRVITEDLTNKILFLLKEMKRLKFTRLDAYLRHIILTKQGELKVIDHVNSFIKKFPGPVLMMEDLNKLGLLSIFLEQVKKIDPETYIDWKES